MKTRRCLLLVMLTLTLFSACAQSEIKMQDGYYMAEAASFDAYGWKEFVAICVSGEKIVAVEYNAKNLSGLLKSWDMEYMRVMDAVNKTYPNEYARTYATNLLNRQDPLKVDAVTGATHSHVTFRLLAEVAITQAKVGDKNVAFVEIEMPEG